MPQSMATHVIPRSSYDAVLFDLDGVITDTASLHAACWKTAFDEYLQTRAIRDGEEFRPFDLRSDYGRHVDGKPRYDGVRDFLKSRGIGLPEGSPDDPADAETVCGLGNRKDDLVNKRLDEEGVCPYVGTVALLKSLKKTGFKVGVVTSSQNCTTVLKSAGLDGVFDVQVDGNTILEQHLSGKPSPETFLTAANALGIAPSRAVVIEDAIAGVQAGALGRFGLVIGVARKDNAEDLRREGAHLVVADLGELADD